MFNIIVYIIENIIFFGRTVESRRPIQALSDAADVQVLLFRYIKKNTQQHA